MPAPPAPPPTRRADDALTGAATRASAPTLRPTRVPSFALVSAAAPFSPVLAEQPEEYTLGLWRLAQDALLFARAEERAGLFASQADVDGLGILHEHGETARALANALWDADCEAVSEGCAAISRAALARHAPLTAAMFSEARAVLRWDDPVAALDVATLGRDRNDYAAAEWWGLRAAELAQHNEAWDIAVRGYARAADAWEARDRWELVVRLRRRELRVAQLSRSRDMTARATHSLFVAYWYAGIPHKAEVFARRALHLYPDSHPRLGMFANDIARWYIELDEHALALNILRGLGRSVDDDETLLLVHANTARAAVRVRDRESYASAVEGALATLDRVRYGGRAAWALGELSLAALHRGDMTRARRWAQQARALARARGEPEVIATARRVLEIVQE